MGFFGKTGTGTLFFFPLRTPLPRTRPGSRERQSPGEGHVPQSSCVFPLGVCGRAAVVLCSGLRTFVSAGLMFGGSQCPSASNARAVVMRSAAHAASGHDSPSDGGASAVRRPLLRTPLFFLGRGRQVHRPADALLRWQGLRQRSAPELPPPPPDPCGVPRRVGGRAEEEAGAAARGHAVGDRGGGRHRSPVDLRRSHPHATSSRALGGGTGTMGLRPGGARRRGGGGSGTGAPGTREAGPNSSDDSPPAAAPDAVLGTRDAAGAGGGVRDFSRFPQFFAVLSAVFCLKRHRNIVGHLCRSVAPRDFGRFGHGTAFFSLSFRIFSHIFAIGLRSARNCPAIFANFRNFSRLDWTLPDRNPPPPSSPGQPTPGVVKQDKSSGGSVDTTKTRSGPQRVRMSSGERPIGAAKGNQSDTEALCQPPPPPDTGHAAASQWARYRFVCVAPPPRRSGRQNMRRAERVTVKGPVKKQQPDGMSHGGGGGGLHTPSGPPPLKRSGPISLRASGQSNVFSGTFGPNLFGPKVFCGAFSTSKTSAPPKGGGGPPPFLTGALPTPPPPLRPEPSWHPPPHPRGPGGPQDRAGR